MASANRPLRALIALFVVGFTLVATMGGVSADQTTITFANFNDKSALQLNGHAVGNNATAQPNLRLTTGLSQAGSAFLKDAISLANQASFSTSFSFQITNPVGCGDGDGVGADGITFVVQTVSNTAGGAGGGIGYAGILKSVAVEFDTWHNPDVGDPNGNHVGIDLSGSVTSLATTNIETRMNNGAVWYAWVDYHGPEQELEARLSQSSTRPESPTVEMVVDLTAVLLQDDAFVGFTSGTGCAGGDHDILSWTFINDFNPVGLNAPPEADAGADQSVPQTGTATSVTLDGSGTTDLDGDNLTYTWTGGFTGGTASGVSPTVTFAAPGVYPVSLSVDDGNGGVDTDEVVITVTAASTAPSPTGDVAGGGGSPAPTRSSVPDTAASGADSGTLAGAAIVAAIVFLVSANALAFAPGPLRRRQRADNPSHRRADRGRRYS